MYTYLLNLTFYAGSDAPEDTDRDLFIMKTSETYSKEQIISAVTLTAFTPSNSGSNNYKDLPQFSNAAGGFYFRGKLKMDNTFEIYEVLYYFDR